jgi:hypothetical protein
LQVVLFFSSLLFALVVSLLIRHEKGSRILAPKISKPAAANLSRDPAHTATDVS